MLTKVYLKVISDAVMIICMSVISLGIFSKRYTRVILHFVAIFSHLQKCLKKQINEKLQILFIWNSISTTIYEEMVNLP